MKKLWMVLMCAGMLQLGACSMNTQQLADGEKSGAVPAHVEDLLGAASPESAGMACLAQLKEIETPPWQLLRVELRRNRLRSSVLAVAPAGLKVQHLDEVALHSVPCAEGHVYYVVKLLQPAITH